MLAGAPFGVAFISRPFCSCLCHLFGHHEKNTDELLADAADALQSKKSSAPSTPTGKHRKVKKRKGKKKRSPKQHGAGYSPGQLSDHVRGHTQATKDKDKDSKMISSAVASAAKKVFQTAFDGRQMRPVVIGGEWWDWCKLCTVVMVQCCLWKALRRVGEPFSVHVMNTTYLTQRSGRRARESNGCGSSRKFSHLFVCVG